MKKSLLQRERAAYQPKLPKGLQGAVKVKEGEPTQSVGDQEEIRKDPHWAKCLLDKYRNKAYKRLRSSIMLVSKEAIETLKTITPSYLSYQQASSEENFAANDFHEHNVIDMDHFCLIELMEKDNEFTDEEYALFGKAPETIRKVKKAIACFDDCLIPSV